jgi:hypothetical protein
MFAGQCIIPAFKCQAWEGEELYLAFFLTAMTANPIMVIVWRRMESSNSAHISSPEDGEKKAARGCFLVSASIK